MGAAEAGFHSVVAALCAMERVDPNLGNLEGVTPLMVATLHGHRKVVEVLRTIPRIEVNQGTEKIWRSWPAGKTALMLAAQGNHVDCVRALRQFKALKVNQLNSGGSAA